MINEETIAAIKSQMKIVDVVQEFVKLKRHGVNHTGLCPFHNEKTGSFTVSAAKEMYKCFGCGKSGDSIQFLIDHEKMDYPAAIAWLGKKYNIEVDDEKKDFVKPDPRLEKLDQKKLTWFEQERKISNNTLLRFGITEAREWMPQFEKEVPVICFNYLRGQDVVNIKFRGPKKSFKLAKNAELIFYNLNALDGENTAVIVEGEIDCLTMHECGIYNCVSVPNGAAKGNQRLEYLDNCWQHFEGIKKVIIATDNDYPGGLLKEELARRLGKEKCFTVEWPKDCKDANDVLLKHGKQAVAIMVENAKEWPLEGIITMDEMFDDVTEWFHNGYPAGAETKIPGFDDLLTFIGGQLTVVTGIPGHGKDEFLNYIMTSLTKQESWPWGICGFEEPAKFHVTKLAEKIAGKSFAFRKNDAARMSQGDFDRAIAMIDKYYFFINIEQTGATTDMILKKAEELVRRKGIKGLVINPWNCLEHKMTFGMNETQYISQELSKMITFAVRFDVHVFLVAHPAKMRKVEKTGKYEVPTLYSVSGSAHFFNKTHNGICVYRDTQSNVVDVYVQKVKWPWTGQTGFSSYHFDTQTRQYGFLTSSVIDKKEIPGELGAGNWRPVQTGDLFDNAGKEDFL